MAATDLNLGKKYVSGAQLPNTDSVDQAGTFLPSQPPRRFSVSQMKFLTLYYKSSGPVKSFHSFRALPNLHAVIRSLTSAVSCMPSTFSLQMSTSISFRPKTHVFLLVICSLLQVLLPLSHPSSFTGRRKEVSGVHQQACLQQRGIMDIPASLR